VQLHPHADEQRFLQQAGAQGLRRLSRVYGTTWFRMAIPTGAVPAQAVARARSLPGVLKVTRDIVVSINDQIPPRDPIYQDDDDPSTKPCDPFFEICDPFTLVDQWGLFKVEAENAWRVTRGSPNVVIAVLDSGIALDHDDLRSKIWTNPGEIPGNGIDDDGNGVIDDVHGADFVGGNVGSPFDDPASKDGSPDVPLGGEWVPDFTATFGIRFAGDPAVGDAIDNDGDGFADIGVTHGTMVAGIIGAATDNVNPATGQFEGMAGACWHCKLMPVRLINAEGWAFGSDAAAAIYYAVNMGAHVINISWGIDLSTLSPSDLADIQVLADAIDFAVSHGVIVVAAAGNGGTIGLNFPASLPSVISVGSSNWLDRRSEFSSFAGPGQVLDVLAPGELIWSTAVVSAYDALLYELLGLPGFEPGTATYAAADGTSFAAPLVSGYVGLILSLNPGATLAQVRQIIRSNAKDILDPEGIGSSLVGYDPLSGFGRVRMVVPSLNPGQNLSPVANAGPDRVVSVVGQAQSATVALNGSGSFDADGTIVSYQWLENGAQIATGQTASVSLGLGVHTITLRVTDDDQASSDDQVTIEVGTVDLTVTAVSNPPATAFTGGTFSVTDTTTNTGSTTTPGSTTRYYLSTDATKSVGDTLLGGSRAVPALAQGVASSGTASVTIPASTPSGSYRLLACADDTSSLGETDEANNCFASSGAVQVTAPQPDLVVTSLEDPPTTTLSGGSLRPTDITKNTGAANAGASTTRYYLSLDTTRDVGDILLSGARAIPALGPGAISTDTATVFIPAGTAAGAYYVLACADDLGVVSEVNETNNCVASVRTTQVTLPTADLAVTVVSDPPVAAVPGSSFLMTDTTLNVGPVTIGATTTRYVLSVDGVRSADDVVIGNRGMGALGPGVASVGSAVVTIPVGTATATYFVLACADDTGQVVEANEVNNCRAAAGPVAVAPATADYVVTAVSEPPVTVAASAGFVVTDTTQNGGTGGGAASSTRYYLSTNTVRDAADVLLSGARAVPALGAGAASSGSVTATIPANTAVGPYYLLACADDTGAVPETNEGNNCRASAGTVQVTPASADLVVSSVEDPSANTLSGGSFRVTDITRNVGAANAATSTTRFYLSLNTIRDAGDVLLTGARAIPPLVPGAFSTDALTVFIPSGTPAGTYYLLGCADDLGVVTETNESNNCVASVRTTLLALPTADLAVTAVSDPAVAAVPGSSFLMTDTTLNVGPVTIGATTTRYVLSVDGVRSADDVVIGSRGMGALGPGVSSVGSAVATIPVGTATATYFVLACADDTGQVVEANEINNCRAAAGTVAVAPATADYVVTAVSEPPVTIPASAGFAVTDTTQNAGTGGAPASTTRYYLSSNAVRDAGDVLLSGVRAVPALGAGAVSTGSVTATIPANTAVGPYYLLACADDTAAIPETNESNNCRASTGTVQVTPASADLVVSSVEDPSANTLSGGSFRATDITRNVGAANAAASTTQFYLSLNTIRDAGDVLLTGARGIPPLAPGAFSTNTVTVFIPSGTPAGPYYLLACADDLSVVTETNESNNCVASVRTTLLALPTADLAVTAVSDPPVAAVPGTSFWMTDTTLNVGPVSVPATTTRYVLSVDGVRSADDVVIGSRGMGALGPGVSSVGPGLATIPVGTATGTYFVLACADDTAQLVEANEINNCRAAAGTVAVAPATADYVVTAVSEPPVTIPASAGFVVTDTTQNAGTGGAPASTTRYYLSSNTVRDAGDVLLTGVRAVPALGAGAVSTGSVTATIPANTAVGPYYLLACSDDTSAIPETNESNNCRASTTTAQVTPASADLVVSSVDDPSANTLSGGSFRVTDITRNVGAANAGASTTRFYLSLDAVWSTGDVLLTGTRSIPPLSVNAWSSNTVTVFIPAGTPAGTYFLLACADDLGVVAETNESNNCVAAVRTTQVTLPTADLAVTAVSDPPAAAAPGASFWVTDTTLNVGASSVPASTTRYVLSVDGVRSADDILLGSRGMGALGPGVPSVGPGLATIPAATAPGTYFLLACADDTAQIVEASEANNCRAATGTIAVGP
jgi:subtilisin family serine protease